MASEMDVTWALEQVREYKRLHERVPLQAGEDGAHKGAKTRARGSKDERDRQGRRLLAVAEAVFESPPRWPSVELASELEFELEEGAEVRMRLGLASPGPQVAASSLHPWVWTAARAHWDSGNHGAALWAAAINVNSRLQRKLGRQDIGETKLIQEAFATSPPGPNRSRLRLCGTENPDLFRDRHLGASNLGAGLFAAVRNRVNHVGADDIDEQEALESLAAWSLLARWIDAAAVDQLLAPGEGSS